MAKKLHLRNCKLPLGQANGEAMLPAEMEDLPEVVNVVKTEGKLTKDEAHQDLKGVPSIPGAKGHP